MSLINRLKRIGDSGDPCQIPKASNLYKILPIGIESYAFFKSRKAR